MVGRFEEKRLWIQDPEAMSTWWYLSRMLVYPWRIDLQPWMRKRCCEITFVPTIGVPDKTQRRCASKLHTAFAIFVVGLRMVWPSSSIILCVNRSLSSSRDYDEQVTHLPTNIEKAVFALLLFLGVSLGAASVLPSDGLISSNHNVKCLQFFRCHRTGRSIIDARR